jgi:hypothetical protein
MLLTVSAATACMGTVGSEVNGPSVRGDGEGSASPAASEAAGKTEAAGIGTRAFALCESGGPEAPSPRLLRLMTRREYRNTLRDLLFAQDLDVSSLPLEPRVKGFDNNAASSVVTGRHADEYLNLAIAQVDKALKEKKSQLLTCQPTAPDCKAQFVDKFGLRAFRRPLTSDEKARYTALFAAESAQNNFDEGLRLVMTSMLVSANFLYRSEVGEAKGQNFQLTPYEVASALSYLYWGSMPDQALFDAAAQNKLGTKAELEAQARRLLADARAQEQVSEFSLQWLRSDSLLSAFKDKGIYPNFSDGLRNAMLEEQRRFVTDVALTRDGKFSELFTADYVYANGELARFYNLNPAGNDFAKVSATPDSGRGGLLSLGAVLAAHAHSNESSPIKRGLFVRDRLLCQELPPPPPSLDTTPPGLDPTLTTRARFAKHTASSSCSGCHKYIDGVGFGLEGFDGVGQRRTVENSLPIDESGELRAREALGEETMDPFKGPRELGSLIAESPAASACLTLQYYRFARGYQEQETDACSLSKLKTSFESKDLTIKELLVNVALLDSFTLRRGE